MMRAGGSAGLRWGRRPQPPHGHRGQGPGHWDDPGGDGRLFQHQPNYDYGISLRKAEEAWEYDYQSLFCETLRDRCGDLVRRYCSTCPFALVSNANNQLQASE